MPARYLETIDVDPADLHPYPGNPNVGDVRAVRGSVKANGQYRSVVARRLPDGSLEILAGHTTTEATATALGTTRVEVIQADDATARRIVAADNATARKATMDEDALLALLDKVNAEDPGDGLTGAGYSPEEHADLARLVQAPTLEDFAAQVGGHTTGDGWPTLHLRVPHHVSQAWQGHLDGHGGDVTAAFAGLLGVGTEPEGWDGT